MAANKLLKHNSQVQILRPQPLIWENDNNSRTWNKVILGQFPNYRYCALCQGSNKSEGCEAKDGMHGEAASGIGVDLPWNMDLPWKMRIKLGEMVISWGCFSKNMIFGFEHSGFINLWQLARNWWSTMRWNGVAHLQGNSFFQAEIDDTVNGWKFPKWFVTPPIVGLNPKAVVILFKTGHTSICWIFHFLWVTVQW